MQNATINWVKKLVSAKEWNTHYQECFPYCFLSKEGSQVWIGFSVANDVPPDCYSLTDDELETLNNYRTEHSIYPLVYEKEEE